MAKIQNLVIGGKQVHCIFSTPSGPLCRAVGSDTKGVIPESVTSMCLDGEPWQDAREFMSKHGLRPDLSLSAPKKPSRKSKEGAIVGKW